MVRPDRLLRIPLANSALKQGGAPLHLFPAPQFLIPVALGGNGEPARVCGKVQARHGQGRDCALESFELVDRDAGSRSHRVIADHSRLERAQGGVVQRRQDDEVLVGRGRGARGMRR